MADQLSKIAATIIGSTPFNVWLRVSQLRLAKYQLMVGQMVLLFFRMQPTSVFVGK